MINLNNQIAETINKHILDYTNYENEVLDLIEFLKIEEDKAKQIVLKRYPQLEIN